MRRLANALVTVVVVAGLVAPGGLAGAQQGDAPPPSEHQALTVLPPGNSGHITVGGQARGKASGNPDDYGAHVDDQREMYWNFDFKPGDFITPSGTPEQPKAGVRIYRDAYGVPAVYGDTGRDVWWGVGWSAARDRLFLMDAVRRLASGRLAELVGPSGVPGDAQARILTYTAAEYDAMFAQLDAAGRESVEGYVDGINAYLADLRTRPRDLPAEYVLLSSVPEPWTVRDILAGGVLITRTVAAEGGNEFENVRLLRTLEEALGREAGRSAFQDLNWYDDPKAAVTVPGTFANDRATPPQRAARFGALADYAATLPLELAAGPGTGATPEPDVVSGLPGVPAAVRESLLRAVDSLVAFGDGLHGGSFAVVVGPSRTRDGNAMLMSEPQLGYSFPSLLYEIEVHGGGYDARGVGVPGMPTVGIGYGTRIAWALTTGYSKTIDSYIETTRTSGDRRQYLHRDQWHDEQCRTETVRYRAAAEGAPAGPPVFTHEVEACRTGHGPVVARTPDGALARSVQYSMWGHELDNLAAILQWNRAKNLEEFVAGVRLASWNENVAYADADGHIAFFHPGRYLDRSPNVDQRFPLPGTGEYDPLGYLPFEQMPHSIDPPRGYLANWNNKPAAGWIDGEGIPPTSRPAGPGQRVTSLVEQLEARRDFTFESLREIDRVAGTRDHRWREYAPLLRLLDGETVDGLALLRSYDGTAWDGTSAADSPAATLFREFVEQLRASVFDALPPEVRERQAGIGSHVFDHSPLDNALLRVLRPSTSGIRARHDWLRGREPAAVVRAALTSAVAAVRERYGDVESWRAPHPRSEACSLTGGVIGPCLDMPYVDRGSWIHLVGFDPPARGPKVASPPGAPKPRRELPATGWAASGPAFGVGLLVLGAAMRRRVRS